jgi:outer membrane protein OmpA-like peptidoglycan-associated protein
MKRTLGLLVSLALVAGMASAAPSLYGSNGLIWTIKPDNCGPMSFGVGFHALYAMDSDEGGVSPNTWESSWKGIDVYPHGYFAINDMLEISAAPAYSFNFYSASVTAGGTTTDTSYSVNGGLDTRIGLKGSFIRGEGFNLGAYLGYTYRSARKFNYAGGYPWVNGAYEKADDYSPTGAINFLLIPGIKAGKGCAHLNIGANYNLDKWEVDVAGTTVDYIYPKLDVPFGIGVGYDVGMVDLMLDITGTAWVNDTNEYPKSFVTTPATYTPSLMNYPLWITPGLRFKFGPGFNFDLGFAYNMQTKDSTLTYHNRGLDWMAVAGLAFAPCKMGPKVPATGSIAGKVTDKAGKGLAAVVTAAGLTANTDPATGAYTIAGIEIKNLPVEVKADAKGYIAKSSSVMLTKKNKKTPAVQDFVLELKPIPASDVTGIITDQKDGKPLANATLTFKGPKTVTAKTDAAGKYMAKLEEGNYQVTAAAEGYKPFAFEVTAKGGMPVNKSARLVKTAEKFAFSNIYFATGKATLTPNAEAALQQVYDILKEHPELKVEIGGHTDNLGGKVKNLKLSQARAEAVVQWLVAKGLPGSQMVAKGYGMSVPVASNKTKAGREQNRRIEVSVIQ